MHRERGQPAGSGRLQAKRGARTTHKLTCVQKHLTPPTPATSPRGGKFLFDFVISPNYPYDAPKVKCKTKVRRLGLGVSRARRLLPLHCSRGRQPVRSGCGAQCSAG